MHLFISYAKKDTRNLALNLADALNALNGISAWVDSSLRAGKSWELEIQKQIDRCDTMIVLYSPDLNRHKQGESESYVLTEIAYAKYTAKKPIIPVMAQKTDAPISLTLEHYIDFIGIELSLDELVNAICDELDIHTPSQASEPLSSITPVQAQQSFSIEDALHKSHNFIGTHNSDWTAIIQTFEINGLSLDMCLVPVGSFQMGSNDISNVEKPVHQQVITQSYWIGLHPITNAQWRFAVDNNKGGVKIPDWASWYNDKSKNEHPVVGVTWYQVQEFLKWLGDDCQLPTEVQWEYAARGVDCLIYPFGNDFKSDLVVYDENSNNSTAAIARRPHGASWVGAQDMIGNIWEWTNSFYQAYPSKQDDGGNDPNSSAQRVLRGGSFYSNPNQLRATYRHFNFPFNTSRYMGFRFVMQI